MDQKNRFVFSLVFGNPHKCI